MPVDSSPKKARPAKWLLVWLLVLCLAILFILYASNVHSRPMFTSMAKVRVGYWGLSQPRPWATEGKLKAKAKLAQSDRVIAEAIKLGELVELTSLGQEQLHRYIKDHLEVEVLRDPDVEELADSNVIQLQFATDSASEAQQVLDAIVKGYISVAQQDQRAPIVESLTRAMSLVLELEPELNMLESELKSLKGKPSEAGRAAALRDAIQTKEEACWVAQRECTSFDVELTAPAEIVVDQWPLVVKAKTLMDRLLTRSAPTR